MLYLRCFEMNFNSIQKYSILKETRYLLYVNNYKYARQKSHLISCPTFDSNFRQHSRHDEHSVSSCFINRKFSSEIPSKNIVPEAHKVSSCSPSNKDVDTGTHLLAEYSKSNDASAGAGTNLSLETGESSALKRRVEDWGDKFNHWYEMYQDATGISEVRRAQERVSELLDDMSSTSAQRRALQGELTQIHRSLESVNNTISDTRRDSEKLPILLEQFRKQKQLLESSEHQFQVLESQERNYLTQIMSAIRVSHEMERTQQQHTNYRTLALSLISAAVASVVTFITNLKRTRDTNQRIEKTEVHASELHEAARQHHEEGVSSVLQRLEQLEQAITSPAAAVARPTGYENDIRAHFKNELVAAIEENQSKLLELMKKVIVAKTSSGDSLNEEDVASVMTVLGDGAGAMPADNGSVFQISIYMATGAIIGTLMTAVAFAGFK